MSSAAGLLTLLEEDNDTLKQYALTNLDKVVHDYWFQISPSIASVEALYEDESFKNRELAALIASKVRGSDRSLPGGQGAHCLAPAAASAHKRACARACSGGKLRFV